MRWWWQKRADGFEWRDYVRTTILVRRNERRQKVEEAKQAAVFGVKQAAHKGAEAGAAGVEAVGRAGKVAGAAVGRGGAALGAAAARGGAVFGAAAARGAVLAAEAARRGAVAGGAAIGRASVAGLQMAREAARPYAERAADRVGTMLGPVIDVLLTPNLVMPLVIVGIVAAAGGTFRAWNFGVDGQVLLAWGIALIAALLYVLPRAVIGDLPQPLQASGEFLARGVRALPGLNRVPGKAVAGATMAVIVAAVAWWFWPAGGVGTLLSSAGRPEHARPERSDPLPVAVTPLPEVKGRANVLSGDSLKVGSVTLRLAGIEAPEAEQLCAGPGGRRCADSARDALARAVRSRSLRCRLAGEDEHGVRLATCLDGETDIAAGLVQSGHVFAVPGFFARYGSAEGQARAAKAGVWQSDEVERPSEFRAKRWDEAKRAAPEGCPIKGRVASGSRTYVLPWSSSYERVRVRTERGERWFCSEQEARAAGWRPT